MTKIKREREKDKTLELCAKDILRIFVATSSDRSILFSANPINKVRESFGFGFD